MMTRKQTARLRILIAASLIAGMSACSNLPKKPAELPPPPIQPAEQDCSNLPPMPVESPPVSPLPDSQPAEQACDCPEVDVPGIIIGEVEYALVGTDGPLQKARIDTGATTTSVGYEELQHFERDGVKWVKFTIKDRLNGTVYSFERPLVRTAEIKRHGAEPTQRPVVKILVTIGSIVRDIEVTLADRDDFDYPVLIGRNFMDGKVLVDVSQRFVATGATEE